MPISDDPNLVQSSWPTADRRPWAFLTFFSPNSVGTLRVLTVSEKQLMLRSLKRAGVTGEFAAIYSTFTPLDIVQVHFDCAGSQNLPARGVCFRRQRSRCGAVCIFAHGGDFSWQAQGEPRALVLQSRLFVAGARDRGCFTSKCSFRGRCSTLGMVVIVQELRFRDRCRES